MAALDCAAAVASGRVWIQHSLPGRFSTRRWGGSFRARGCCMSWNVIVLAILAGSFAASAEDQKPAPPAQPGKPGSILIEYFRGIAGDAIGELTKNPAFPLHPTDSELAKSFELLSEETQYGSLARGYVVPPA